MRKLTKVGILTLGAASFALPLAPTAFADYAPTTSDVVGVGSDTVQNVMNFVADGRQGYTDGSGAHAAVNGFNFTNPKFRLINFDATPDENDRAGFKNGSTATTPISLSPTIILRAGITPSLRPNGSTAGMTAFDADTAGNINYVRTSRPPKSTEIVGAGITADGTGNHTRTIRLAKDGLQIAVAATTNAPAAGLTVAQLKTIYSCNTVNPQSGINGGAQAQVKWNDITSGASADPIVLEVPQSGSGTRDTFLTDIFGSKSYLPPSGCTWNLTEENDPSALQPTAGGAATSTSTNVYGQNADEISPFSSGRKALFDSGYFHDPVSGAAQTSNINLLATGSGQYLDNRGLFITLRATDAESTTPWQPGSQKNWAQELFIPGNIAHPSNTTIQSDVQSTNSANVTAAGTPVDYVDCGYDYSDASPSTNPCNQ